MGIWESDGQQTEKCPMDNNQQCVLVVMKANYTLISEANRLKVDYSLPNPSETISGILCPVWGSPE